MSAASSDARATWAVWKRLSTAWATSEADRGRARARAGVAVGAPVGAGDEQGPRLGVAHQLGPLDGGPRLEAGVGDLDDEGAPGGGVQGDRGAERGRGRLPEHDPAPRVAQGDPLVAERREPVVEVEVAVEQRLEARGQRRQAVGVRRRMGLGARRGEPVHEPLGPRRRVEPEVAGGDVFHGKAPRPLADVVPGGHPMHAGREGFRRDPGVAVRAVVAGDAGDRPVGALDRPPDLGRVGGHVQARPRRHVGLAVPGPLHLGPLGAGAAREQAGQDHASEEPGHSVPSERWKRSGGSSQASRSSAFRAPVARALSMLLAMSICSGPTGVATRTPAPTA